MQRYLAALKTSGAGHKEPPAFAQRQDVLECLLQYFHVERPDIVPQITYDSSAGLTRASVTIDTHDHSQSQSSTHSTPSSAHSPPTVDRKSISGGRKATSLSLLGTILDGKQQRHEEDAQFSKVMSQYFVAQQTPTHQTAVTPDMMRTTASMVLARLEDHDDICNNEQALCVVQDALRVLHGTLPGAAEQMASRVCVLSERALPPTECIKRLQAFVRVVVRGVQGGDRGSGAGGDGML